MAQVFHAIAEHSPDAAKSVMVDFVPLVFLAMHATASDEGAGISIVCCCCVVYDVVCLGGFWYILVHVNLAHFQLQCPIHVVLLLIPPSLPSPSPDPSSKTALKLWKEAWSEVAPGEEACVRLYLPQLVGVASSALQSQLWPIKAQGAAALATVAEKMGPCECASCVGVLMVGGGSCDSEHVQVLAYLLTSWQASSQLYWRVFKAGPGRGR